MRRAVVAASVTFAVALIVLFAVAWFWEPSWRVNDGDSDWWDDATFLVSFYAPGAVVMGAIAGMAAALRQRGPRTLRWAPDAMVGGGGGSARDARAHGPGDRA